MKMGEGEVIGRERGGCSCGGDSGDASVNATASHIATPIELRVGLRTLNESGSPVQAISTASKQLTASPRRLTHDIADRCALGTLEGANLSGRL